MKCSIILPTLNEEKYIAKTLDSIEKQTFPACDYELLVVDSRSSDTTRDIARNYGASVIDAPRGKLTARDLGTCSAKADVIVSVDADCIYPPSWLERTMQEFNVSTTVGVTGPRLYDMIGQSVSRLFYSACWRFFGSNSAYRKKAYFMSGGFNLNINQQDSKAMVAEEEVLFKERLQAFGTVVYQPDNYIITSARRYVNDKDFKEQIRLKERF